jgi:hypothetical protein
MEGASLFGVVDEVKVIARCPVLQLVTVNVRIFIAPVGVVTIEVSNQDSRMRQHWQKTCTVPSLTWGFVDIGDVKPADPNNIAVLSRHNVNCLSDVTADVCCPAVLWVESVAHKVEPFDVKEGGFVIFDMCLLETDDVSFLTVCEISDEVAFCGRQTLDVELEDPQCWTNGLKAMILLRAVVRMGAGIQLSLGWIRLGWLDLCNPGRWMGGPRPGLTGSAARTQIHCSPVRDK